MDNSEFKIDVIKPGLLIKDRFGNILDARSNVTLITKKNNNIIVDTGLNNERDELIEALRRFNLIPKDIDIVINTHSHLDHCGNNDLFLEAQIFVHEFELANSSDKKNYHLIKGDTSILPGIIIKETPGHTRGSISIFIKGRICNQVKNCAIAGDALPILDNYLKWVPPGINFDPKIAINSMREIIENSEVVIPGHDKPFIIINQTKRIAKYI